MLAAFFTVSSHLNISYIYPYLNGLEDNIDLPKFFKCVLKGFVVRLLVY